jgi:hypothetical protein
VNNPIIRDSISQANIWIWMTTTNSTSYEWGPCNASPYLSYLRSQFQPFVDAHLYALPLVYSFYDQTVLQPFRSLLDEATAPSTIFCYLDKGSAVCVPNSDTTTIGSCVSCRNLNREIEERKLKNETSIRHLMATCDPASAGPKPVPERKKNTTEEVRWLRWFLESSYLFQGTKIGEWCTAKPGLSKARAYLHVLMKKHFTGSALSLTTPGMEGKEEEAAYEELRSGQFSADKKHGEWWEEKLKGIEGKMDFGEVFCSREEGLVCALYQEDQWLMSKCMHCGDEGVTNNTELREACQPDQLLKDVPHPPKPKPTSGAQDRNQQMIPPFTLILSSQLSELRLLFTQLPVVIEVIGIMHRQVQQSISLPVTPN